ncbi:MAG: S8 family serine peptidase [Spirochaetota bacterium]
MRSILNILTILLTCVSLNQTFSQAKPAWQKSYQQLPQYVEGEVVIKWKASASEAKKQSWSAKSSDKSRQKKRVNVLKLNRKKEKKTTQEIVKQLQQDPDVEYAEPNYIYHKLTVPNDPEYSQLWGAKNSGQSISNPSYNSNNPGISGYDMNLEAAWDKQTDCSSTLVAVIDSGVNYNHEDLQDNLWDGSSCVNEFGSLIAGDCPHHGWNYVDSNNDTMDYDGHGTHVMGTLASIGNNSLGATGVCWSAKVMIVKVLGSSGATSANLEKAIRFAVNNGAKVINMSLGGSGQSNLVKSSISDAKSSDVVFIVAAGNDGENLSYTSQYPCEYSLDNIVCVGALDQKYNLASFSNYGSNAVDVSAPGVNIYSPWAGEEHSIEEDFSSSWIPNGSGDTWGVSNCTLSGTSYPILGVPNNCNKFNSYNSGSYQNNTNSGIYKTFTINSGVDAINLNFFTVIDVEPSLSSCYDTFRVKYASGSLNPLVSGTQVSSDLCGSKQSASLSYDLSDCKNKSQCSIGFSLESDYTVSKSGVAIADFSITMVDKDVTNVYKIINGTSMASPNVAGIAAMIRSYNPNYTYKDTIEAIENSGTYMSTLSGKTKTARAVNGKQALDYLAKPKNLQVSFE